MSSFESMSEDEQLQFAHALERKGREMIELLLRKRRVAGDLAPLLAPDQLDGVVEKIHAGIDARIRKAATDPIVIDAQIAPKEEQEVAITPQLDGA